MPLLTAELENLLTDRVSASAKKLDILQESIPDMESTLKKMTAKSRTTVYVMNRINRHQPKIENQLLKNKNRLESLQRDVTDASAEIKLMENNFWDFDTWIDSS